MTTSQAQSPERGSPDFIILGFPKCGTQAVLHNLGAHPEIHVHPAEIGYFGLDRMSRAEYLELFRTHKPLTGEKTATYVYSDAAMAQIRREVPSARLILCLRHPIHMLHSFYHFRVSNHGKPWARATIDGKRWSLERIIRTGMELSWVSVEAVEYVRHLRERILPWADPGRVLFVVQERLQRDMQGEFDRIHAFLGVAPRVRDYAIVNSSSGGRDLYPSIRYDTPDYREALDWLIQHLDPFNQALFELLGDDLPEWRHYDRLYRGLADGEVPEVPPAPGPAVR